MPEFRNDNARRHRERMERERQENNDWNHVTGLFKKRGDPEVVPSAQLGIIIIEWRERWLRERDPRTEHVSDIDQGITPVWNSMVMGPIEWLCERTGISSKQIHRITSGEQRFTSLEHADLILSALDQNYRWQNGDVEVVPSPYWSNENWLAYMHARGCA